MGCGRRRGAAERESSRRQAGIVSQTRKRMTNHNRILHACKRFVIVSGKALMSWSSLPAGVLASAWLSVGMKV
ncbi:hypothetical protein BCR44DRAFT_1441732 [Catenaria anguillulae PL171]|uniref:Uncharacterized protein n=1 Tax=Catenaria anguillulae PL171 TaxID=765915 RepID=A0A1Y2HAR3_9FUNG|nr:hypothetical protein BCR44DRAFT_1441732 [Catenaria anguillulae PL171]